VLLPAGVAGAAAGVRQEAGRGASHPNYTRFTPDLHPIYTCIEAPRVGGRLRGVAETVGEVPLIHASTLFIHQLNQRYSCISIPLGVAQTVGEGCRAALRIRDFGGSALIHSLAIFIH
jgi:hypothetical protein